MKFPLLLIILFPLTLLNAQNFSPEEADHFLDQLAAERAKMQGVTKNFREEKRLAMVSQPLITSGTIAFQPPDHFRREVTGENASFSASNGETLWIYYPELNEAEKYNLKERGPVRDSILAIITSLNFQDLKKNFRYQMHQNSEGWELNLEPKSSALRRIFQSMTIQLEKQRRVSRINLVTQSGDKTLIAFWNEKEKSFPADYFNFTPPKNANISSPLGK
ncbi:MAG: outer membrane lipoprotein carrier protein LolA [Chthoniobacterales bacterium]